MSGHDLTGMSDLNTAQSEALGPIANFRNDLSGEHICIFYSSGDDLLRQCRILAEVASADSYWACMLGRDLLGRIGRSILDCIERNGIVTAVEELLKAGSEPVTISLLQGALQKLTVRMLPASYSGLLVLLDMSWIVDTPLYPHNHEEIEEAIQGAAMLGHIKIICAYDKGLFPPGILLNALRTHPAVALDDLILFNPLFLPSGLRLGDAQSRLDWAMAMLRRLQPYEDDGKVDPRGARRGGLSGQVAITEPTQPAGGDVQGVSSAVAPPGQWRIHCLGELEVYRRDGSRVAWGGASGATVKIKTAFAYLIQKGTRGAGADEMADVIWPKASSLTQSLNRLYHTMHCLRQLLADPATQDGEGTRIVCKSRRYYLVLAEGAWIDIPIFERLCRQGEQLFKAGQLQQALLCCRTAERIYRGCLFSDIPLDYVDNVEQDWCWSQRFWNERMYLKVVYYLAAMHRITGDHQSALSYCKQALKLNPCYERAHREAMRIYHDIGRSDALERQYQLCCESLRRYEQREPSVETSSLAQELNNRAT